MKRMDYRKKIIILLAVGLISLLIYSQTIVTYKQKVIPAELASFFKTFSSDSILTISEAKDFYNWIEQHVIPRYDDENDPLGVQQLAQGLITLDQLGDGREGIDYWQLPIETYNEVHGDCEDMALLELAFYQYWSVDSLFGSGDTNDDGIIDHAVCLVKWNSDYAIVDNAYSSVYGQSPNFVLIKTTTLEGVYNEHWGGISFQDLMVPVLMLSFNVIFIYWLLKMA